MCKMKKKAQILWTQLEVCCPEKQLSFGEYSFVVESTHIQRYHQHKNLDYKNEYYLSTDYQWVNNGYEEFMIGTSCRQKITTHRKQLISLKLYVGNTDNCCTGAVFFVGQLACQGCKVELFSSNRDHSRKHYLVNITAACQHRLHCCGSR